MRIHLISDVHIEFHRDRGQDFLEKTAEAATGSGADVICIAGDFATNKDLAFSLGILCDLVPSMDVLYVPGNHTYYGCAKDIVDDALSTFEADTENFTRLQRGSVKVVKGQRFVGCTMWFPYDESSGRYECMMNDFRVIPGFRDWVYHENSQDVQFLKDTVEEGDVVVTHYLPSHQSIAPQFNGDVLNRFFLCPMDDLIERAKPAMWLNGHTHTSTDYLIGNTRVVCNPYGYHDHDVNSGFDPGLMLEIK